MQHLIRRLLPDSINDIIALVALFRPGPLQSGAVDDYINRKHGKDPVSFPHPTLHTALEGTYGVVLYQEQVMQIAQVLAGFTLGQADLLRRAMGKKKPLSLRPRCPCLCPIRGAPLPLLTGHGPKRLVLRDSTDIVPSLRPITFATY